MNQLLKQYKTFFVVQMDEEALRSFTLPSAVDPVDSAERFNRICFIFLLPQNSVRQAEEDRLPVSLRRQLYRPGAHVNPTEVDVYNPRNEMPKNCVIVNQQSQQTLAFILGMLKASQNDFKRTVVFSRNPSALKSQVSCLALCDEDSPAFLFIRELEEFHYSRHRQGQLDALIMSAANDGAQS